MGIIKWRLADYFNYYVICKKGGAIHMIYQLIYSELVQFINADIGWQLAGIEYLSFGLTLLFILLFILLPVYLFVTIINLSQLNEYKGRRTRKRYRGW